MKKKLIQKNLYNLSKNLTQNFILKKYQLLFKNNLYNISKNLTQNFILKKQILFKKNLYNISKNLTQNFILIKQILNQKFLLNKNQISYKIYFKNYFILILIIFLLFNFKNILSKELLEKNKLNLNDIEIQNKTNFLINSSNEKALEFINKMDPETSSIILSQLRFALRNKNPDIDKFYFLISKLEQNNATILAQKRLNNLLIVIAFCITLFSSFVFYVWLDQKKIYKKIKLEYIKKNK